MAIKQPRNTAGLTWNTNFASNWAGKFSKAQKFIDSEVLRCSDPYTPKQTGSLINSGKSGTVIGSGEVKYLAPYAASQYYDTAKTRPYDPQRGAEWFERMKVVHKKAILEGAKKV